jgi:hypothetical protein
MEKPVTAVDATREQGMNVVRQFDAIVRNKNRVDPGGIGACAPYRTRDTIQRRLRRRRSTRTSTLTE